MVSFFKQGGNETLISLLNRLVLRTISRTTVFLTSELTNIWYFYLRITALFNKHTGVNSCTNELNILHGRKYIWNPIWNWISGKCNQKHLIALYVGRQQHNYTASHKINWNVNTIAVMYIVVHTTLIRTNEYSNIKTLKSRKPIQLYVIFTYVTCNFKSIPDIDKQFSGFAPFVRFYLK